MKLRWSEIALSDLEKIAQFLNEQTPQNAPNIVSRIHEAAQSLPQFPSRGRIGRIRMTREYVVTDLPYVIVYTVGDDVVHLVRILHGAQKWP